VISEPGWHHNRQYKPRGPWNRSGGV